MEIDLTEAQKKYAGMWVGLAEDQTTVVGAGETLKEALEDAKKKGCKDPIMMRMPKEDITYVGYGI
ncbi:hypothetical protein HY971_00825 [Candidatus Kaiserbacteria bacterium]|nr:hypothetical protein [Candidatus Kaiserbacteria bacterium]